MPIAVSADRASLDLPKPTTRPPKARLSSLDGLRAVAAVTVLLYHVARHLDKAVGATGLKGALQFGHAGVDLFFVISGFVILFVHWPDMGRPDRLLHYAGRRLNRIYPPYWMALAVTVMLAAGHGLPAFGWLLQSATLLPATRAPVLDVAWTLQHEMLFYVLFSLLIVSRRAGVLVLGLWTLGNAVAALTPIASPLFSAYNLEFIAGMGAAVAVRRRQVPPWAFALGLVALAGCALAEDTGLLNGYGSAARVLYGEASALLVAGLIVREQDGLLRVPAWLRQIGSGSYSIYLFQFVWIGAAWRICTAAHLDWLPAGAMLILLTGCAIGGGMVASRLVEGRFDMLRPFRQRNKDIGAANLAAK